jgi:hemerythrin-like domain-containing protein
MPEQPQPNVALSLLAIHAVITRGVRVSLESAHRFIETGYPDPATQEGFTNYILALAVTIHGHHSMEDLLAFPKLKEHVPDAPYELLFSQHQLMLPLLDGLNVFVEKSRAGDQSKEALSLLENHLLKFDELWHPHIGIEEENFTVQKLAALMTPDVHISLLQVFGAFSQQHSQPAYLTIPFTLYNLEPDVRQALASGMPAEVTQSLVPVVWKEQWASMRPFLME